MRKKQSERSENIIILQDPEKKELKKKSEEWKEYSKAVLDVMGGVCFG